MLWSEFQVRQNVSEKTQTFRNNILNQIRIVFTGSIYTYSETQQKLALFPTNIRNKHS